MKTGFIGLGHLGTAMAKRLISEGTDIVVWNRTKEKARGLGVDVAESPADLVGRAGIVFLNLFDSEAVEDVLRGREGLLEGDCKDRVIVDTSTNHFERTIRFSVLLRDCGAHYLEAPVLGSVGLALQGALTVLVSGEKTAYEKALPFIGKIGKKTFYLGEPGRATKMKLINNLVLGVLMASIAEAVVFGEESGIGKEDVLDILSSGAGSSAVLNAKRDALLTGDFSCQFSSSLIYKDLCYLHDLARTFRRPLFTGSMTKELFAMTFAQGLEDLDFSAVYSLLRDISKRPTTGPHATA